MPVQTSEPTRLTLEEINGSGSALIGQRVVTRGCIADASTHGLYIEPCETRGTTILILILNTGYYDFARAIECGHMKGTIEADISGQIELITNMSRTGEILALRMDAIQNGKCHKRSRGLP